MTTAATTTTTNNNDILADFALQVFERARQLQNERTGLMSNKDAMSKAALETFDKALTDIQNVITYTRLFGLEVANEQVKKTMLDAAKDVTKEKDLISTALTVETERSKKTIQKR